MFYFLFFTLLSITTHASNINLPERVLRSFQNKHQQTLALTSKESIDFLQNNILSFLEEKVFTTSTDIDYDPTDPECLIVKDTNKYEDHSDEEWQQEIERIKGKYSIFKLIPGVGIFGMTEFQLKKFDGRIIFKITADHVQLLLHGAEGISNIPENGQGCNVMGIDVLIGDFEFLKKKKILKEHWFGKPEFVKQAMTLPVLSSINIKLQLAIDANIHLNQDNEWKVVKGKDVNVCIPSIKAAGMPAWTIKALTAVIPGIGGIDLKKKIKDLVYCTFKYTLLEKEGTLATFLEFVATQKDISTTTKQSSPLIEFSIQKQLTKHQDAKVDFMTEIDIILQFRQPSFPFVKFLLIKGAEASKLRVASTKSTSDLDRSNSLHSEFGNEIAGLDTSNVEKASQELNEYLNTMAEAMSNQKNHAMASIVETVANIIFDLDNDLRCIYQGDIKLENSNKIWIGVKQFQVAGKVTKTKIPIELFLKSLEDLDGISELATRSQKTNDLKDYIEMNGAVTLAKFTDIEIEGKFRPFMGPKYRDIVLRTFFGKNGFLRDTGESFANLLMENEVTASIESLHKEDPLIGEAHKVKECSIDKTAIKFGGKLHYKGPFQMNELMTKLTSAANVALLKIARHKQEQEERGICLADNDAVFDSAIKEAEEMNVNAIRDCEQMLRMKTVENDGDSKVISV